MGLFSGSKDRKLPDPARPLEAAGEMFREMIDHLLQQQDRITAVASDISVLLERNVELARAMDVFGLAVAELIQSAPEGVDATEVFSHAETLRAARESFMDAIDPLGEGVAALLAHNGEAFRRLETQIARMKGQ